MKKILFKILHYLESDNPIRAIGNGFIGGLITMFVIYIAMSAFIIGQLVGDYGEDNQSLYRAWYDIYIEEPQELTKFVKPYAGEWGITAEYQYQSDHSVIALKYEEVFKKLQWDFQKEEGKTKTYAKNDLICDLTELEGNKWQVKISVKGYHDKGFFEKLIFGNTKTA